MSKLNDKINYISKLSPLKVWNSMLLYASYKVGKITRKPIAWGLPDSIAIEPTTACNLKCPECPSGLRSFTRNTGNLKFDLFKRLIDQSKKHLTYLTLYFQGEPYINPNFLEIVSYASSKKIYTATSTNGHFLTKKNAEATVHSGLDRLIISLDGITQETYSQYRKEGQLETVLEGARNMVAAKKAIGAKTPHIIFQFLVVKHNEHEIDDAKKLANEIGVDEIRFKTAQIYDYKNGHELIPTNTKYSRYKPIGESKFALKSKLGNHCWRMSHSPVITWDGMLVPCCFDKDAQYKMGNLQSEDITQIWKGEKYRAFRKRLSQSRKDIDICTNCTEGLKVFE